MRPSINICMINSPNLFTAKQANILMASSLMEQNYNEVLFEEKKGMRKAILNRPKQLNSLTYEMMSQMLRRLRAFEEDPNAKLVVLKGNGRAFCAGGDVKSSMSYLIEGHWSYGASFYRRQLNLDYTLGTYQKPVVAIMDGIVMGGGAGLTMHSNFRIVTEKTRFAMPEASIGLFPDCGASHFLSRLPGFFGDYLGLTGTRLDRTEMLACGLATHFVLSQDLASMEDALESLTASAGGVDISTISKTINKFVEQVHLKKESVYERLDVINKCFTKETVEEILSSLEELATYQQEKWIISAINSMKSASPTSLKIFLRMIREGRKQSLRECLVTEFRATCHILRRTINSDYYEGGRAMLVDKSKPPKWMPSKLELVSQQMVETYFYEVDDDDDWVPLQLPPRSPLAYSTVSRL